MMTTDYFDGRRLSDMESGGGFAIFDQDVRDNADHLVVVLAQHRESDVLDESNFAYGLAQFGMLDAGNKPMDSNDAGTVQVQRYGHPMVGWIDYLVIDDRDEEAAGIARTILERLDGYPVLDEDDFSEREQEELDEYVTMEMDSMTGNMPDSFTVKQHREAAGYALYRHHKTGGNVDDFDTEGNFGYGVARVMIEAGYEDDDMIVAAMAYGDRMGHPDTPWTILAEARTDHKENA